MYQAARMADLAKQKATKEDASVERVLSPLPPIPPIKDTSGNSVEKKLSKNTANSLFVTTVKTELEPESSVMFEIGRKMMRLYLCENHSCEACLEDFRYIEFKYEEDTGNVTQKLLEIGFLELFQQILTRLLRKQKAKVDNKLSYARMSATLFSSGTVINMTDVSSDACRKVIQLRLHTDIINLLKSDYLDQKQIDQGLSSTLCDFVDILMTVLYNVIQTITEARELYREQGIIDVLQRFRTGTTKSLSCLVLMFLAWVINDEENSILNSNDEAFSFLNEELKCSLEEGRHRSESGYKSTEILTAINKLVVSDVNKEQFVKSGMLSSYVLFLDPQFDESEQFLAVQGIWTLAFKYAEEIKLEKLCVERLELLLKTSEHDRVRSEVNGALITLGVNQENPTQAPKISSKEAAEDEEKGKRIFISYQHSSKETVLKIRDRLRDHGFRVWMDVDDICGSIAEDISNGIDTSSVVLTCLSQRYYESPYCKKEVIYADDSQKEIIPLTLEPKYKPHGWLSFRMSDKLRIDFSQPQSFDASIRALLQRLKKSFDEADSGRRNDPPKVAAPSSHVSTVDTDANDSDDTCEPEMVQTEMYSVSYSTSTMARVFTWTKADVREWLERNNFHHLMKWFDDYDGQLLLEFQYVLEKSPELVAPSFIAAHSVKDFLRLIMALRLLP